MGRDQALGNALFTLAIKKELLRSFLGGHAVYNFYFQASVCSYRSHKTVSERSIICRIIWSTSVAEATRVSSGVSTSPPNTHTRAVKTMLKATCSCSQPTVILTPRKSANTQEVATVLHHAMTVSQTLIFPGPLVDRRRWWRTPLVVRGGKSVLLYCSLDGTLSQYAIGTGWILPSQGSISACLEQIWSAAPTSKRLSPSGCRTINTSRTKKKRRRRADVFHRVSELLPIWLRINFDYWPSTTHMVTPAVPEKWSLVAMELDAPGEFFFSQA